jgi:hypothetical protein
MITLQYYYILAPKDCLQYFTSATGRVKSFNWQDAAAAQQLNNQKYNICFRTELVSGSVCYFAALVFVIRKPNKFWHLNLDVDEIESGYDVRDNLHWAHAWC